MSKFLVFAHVPNLHLFLRQSQTSITTAKGGGFLSWAKIAKISGSPKIPEVLKEMISPVHHKPNWDKEKDRLSLERTLDMNIDPNNPAGITLYRFGKILTIKKE